MLKIYQKINDQSLNISTKIISLCLILTLPFAAIFSFLGQLQLGISILALCLLYSTCYILKYFNLNYLSKLGTILFPCIGIISFFAYTGKDAGFHYILFFCSSLGAVIFTNKEKLTRVITIFIPILSFVFLELFTDKCVIEILFSNNVNTLLKIGSIFITFTCTLFTIQIYVKQQSEIIIEKDKQKEEIKHSLESVMTELSEKNKLLIDNSSQNAYLAMTSGLAHEIRSTMTCLLSGAELLQLQAKENKNIEIFSKIIIKTVYRLTSLTQSMLSFGGNLAEDSAYFNVDELIEELLILAKLQTKRKSILLNKNVKTSSELYGSKLYISQALINLVMNSITHTEDNGTITISYIEKDDTLILSVKDSGNGIAEEDLDKVFTPKYSSNKSKYNTGFGLTLVKQIMDDHEGKVSINSKLGLGTEIQLHFKKNVKEDIE